MTPAWWGEVSFVCLLLSRLQLVPMASILRVELFCLGLLRWGRVSAYGAKDSASIPFSLKLQLYIFLLQWPSPTRGFSVSASLCLSVCHFICLFGCLSVCLFSYCLKNTNPSFFLSSSVLPIRPKGSCTKFYVRVAVCSISIFTLKKPDTSRKIG